MEDFKFFNVIPYNLGREEQTAKDIIEFYQRTGIPRVLYSLSYHPQGGNAMVKAERLTASFRRLKELLACEPGIKVGVLIQSILGHVIGAEVEHEPWTKVIIHKGKQEGGSSRFCSLDPGFSDYIRKVGAMVAKEKPFFILGDDDIRSWSSGVECFCELHTAEYNRRHGTSFTPEEYRKAVCESDVNSELYKNFDQLRQDTVNRVAALLREGIDSVDPSIPGGSCMPGGEYFFNQDTAAALASKTQDGSVMRICNANYVEQSPRDFVANVFKTQAYRKYHSSVKTVLDESDTFPHSLFSKSAISFHAKETSAIFNGLDGAKLWFVNCRRPGVIVSRKYTDILAKYSKFYTVLYNTVKSSETSGIRIPIRSGKGDWHAITNREPNITPKNSWSEYLGIYGIPFSAEKDLSLNGIYAIRGKDAVDSLSDDELKTLFKGKMLIDGAAALALSERGFAEYMGVKAQTPTFPFNGEYYAGGDAPIYCRTWRDAPELVPQSDKLEILTNMYYSPFYGAKLSEQKLVCPGTVIFNNALGGRICTTVFCTTDEFTPRGGVPRKEWLINLIEAIENSAADGTMLIEHPALAISRKLSGNAAMLMLCNLGFDAIETVELKYSNAAKVSELTADGIWKELNFKQDSGVLSIDRSMACYETLIIKVEK